MFFELYFDIKSEIQEENGKNEKNNKTGILSMHNYLSVPTNHFHDSDYPL